MSALPKCNEVNEKRYVFDRETYFITDTHANTGTVFVMPYGAPAYVNCQIRYLAEMALNGEIDLTNGVDPATARYRAYHHGQLPRESCDRQTGRGDIWIVDTWHGEWVACEVVGLFMKIFLTEDETLNAPLIKMGHDIAAALNAVQLEWGPIPYTDRGEQIWPEETDENGFFSEEYGAWSFTIPSDGSLVTNRRSAEVSVAR